MLGATLGSKTCWKIKTTGLTDFPLALWLALGHGETRVFQKERNDPLCQFMMLSCTPRKRFDYEEVQRTDGRGHNWLIHGIQTGYKNEIKASQTDLPQSCKRYIP